MALDCRDIFHKARFLRKRRGERRVACRGSGSAGGPKKVVACPGLGVARGMPFRDSGRGMRLTMSPAGRRGWKRAARGGSVLKRRKWNPETKARIVLDGLLNGQVSEVCRRYEIRPGQYYKWRDYFLTHSARVFEGPPRNPDSAALVAENEKLKRLVGELTLELNRKSGV